MKLRWKLLIAAGCVGVGLVAAAALLLKPEHRELVAAPPIETPMGPIRGAVEGKLTVYRGIPYAAAPVGDLRWRAPRPLDPWQSILDATRFKPACLQVGPPVPGLDPEPTREDCLTLNIWTPAPAVHQKQPVVVFVYGGDFTNGSGSSRLYWGDGLAEKGVVAVTFNYRLGALGLLAHPELSAESRNHVSGNYSLLDCIAVLSWVRANIAAFGGDPENVTLVGQSAGGYLVSELMVAPPAKGLFRRAAIMSGADMGVAGSPGDIPTLGTAEKIGAAFATSLGAASIADLRKLPGEQIVAKGFEAGDEAGPNRPNVDGLILPRDTSALLDAGNGAEIDLLIGNDREEGATMIDRPLSAGDYKAYLAKRFGAFAERVAAAYPATDDPPAAASQIRLATIDVVWRGGTLAALHARQGKGRTWYYEFSRVPPWEPFKSLKAAGHGAELPYLFGYPQPAAFFFLESPFGAWRDMQLSRQVSSYWVNFARTGDPNDGSLPHWPALKSLGRDVLLLGDDTVAGGVSGYGELPLMDAYEGSLRQRPQ